ncbi:uncharacterized protein CLUP02_01564 [Colletotrichum lupini]|uniref:Uncharacterized protein n=1 Tax=Colletotrichum lupini TaxID=145971 RepID=A0A9Q8SE92_9PEZI|nr:uncharacterized protein CLUP02_01564 [Colletotrichum lupini]UQC74912.1 hypothetical protein CLUP02_01564 [Colletotrichum lupini]
MFDVRSAFYVASNLLGSFVIPVASCTKGRGTCRDLKALNSGLPDSAIADAEGHTKSLRNGRGETTIIHCLENMSCQDDGSRLLDSCTTRSVYLGHAKPNAHLDVRE